MESSTFHSFSAHVPFKQPIVITHYISMVIAFLGFYPLLLTRHIRRQKIYIITASLFFASIGFISGSFIPEIENNTASTLLHLFSFLLLCLVIIQVILLAYRSEKLSLVSFKIPTWLDLFIGWICLIIAFSYLTLAALVFTESCNNIESPTQCLMPVAMGTGFILYGTISMLHLFAIIKLPRPSTPEYYEGVILTFWGFISLLLAGTPILGSEWRAINLGLLWFTGGLFSISLSVQTWIPALRERNIVNALIICLTGRAIVSGLTQVEDTYAAQVHTMLGYILIIGAVARLTQIIFRKSPADNLPHRMFQQNTDTTLEIDDEEEDEINAKDTLQHAKCKHKFIFATITLVTGLLSSLLSICGGILFMGANIGWIRYMRYYIEDPSTYVNITLSVAFVWCAYVFGLCTIYKNLKASNALHQYEYVELCTNNATMTELPLSNRHHPNYDREEEEREWSTVLPPPLSSNMMAATNTMSSPAIMRPESPPPPPSPQQQEEYTMSSSPTMLNSEIITSTLLRYSPPPPAFESTAVTLEKTIRPSEYRAKRRSLLIQSPIIPQTTNNRARSSSSFGVGGVLPDEIIQLQKTPVDSTFRRSWLSSGSSVGYYSGSIDSSSAPNSPNSDQQRPYSSISSTLPHGGGGNQFYQQRQHPHTRRNSANESSFDEFNGIDYVDDDNEGGRRSVHKTESGKRKERRLMHQYYYSSSDNHSNSETITSNSSGSKFKRWSLKNDLLGTASNNGSGHKK